MSELALKARVVKWLKCLHGLWFYKAADQFTSGIPDIILCYEGRFIAIELKAPENKKGATRLQEHNGKMIQEAGGEFYICRSLNEVKNIFGRV